MAGNFSACIVRNGVAAGKPNPVICFKEVACFVFAACNCFIDIYLCFGVFFCNPIGLSFAYYYRRDAWRLATMNVYDAMLTR